MDNSNNAIINNRKGIKMAENDNINLENDEDTIIEDSNINESTEVGEPNIEVDENAEENDDSVKKPNNKKRFAIFAALGLVLVIGSAGGYYAYDYAQDCSLHNQQLERIYNDSLNVAKAVDVDQSTLTYEARLNTINDANETKSNLENELKKDKYKYADGTSPDWDAVVAYYDNVIKKSKEAQVADWTAKVQEHVNFDVNSSSNVEELEQHINSLNALNAEITSDDAREYILNDYKDDGTTLENTIQEQVARYQGRIEAVKQEQKKAEEERQAAAAAAAKKKNKSNNYSSGGSSSSSSNNGGGGSNGGGSNGGSSSGGRFVVAWLDRYDKDGNYIDRVYKYSDGTYSDPWACF